MPSYRTHQRSSDSVDFEHTAALKEMEELTLAEKEHTSPNEHVAQSAQAVVTVSSFSDARTRTPSVNSGRTSRSNSRASQISVTGGEKISIFRDEVGGANARSEMAAKASTESTMTVPTRSGRSKHSRSMSDSAVSQVGATPKTSLRRDRWEVPCYLNGNSEEYADVETSPSDLVRELHDIAAKRAKILNELTTLESEETVILAQLAQSTYIPTRQTPSKPHPDTTMRALKPKTITPILPPPQPTCTQPVQKMSVSKPTHTRPVSAPPKSTPSRPHHRTARTSNRLPLSDKMQETRPLSEITSLHAVYHRTSPADKIDDSIISATQAMIVRTPSRRGRTMRVPMNFGDSSERGEDEGSGIENAENNRVMRRISHGRGGRGGDKGRSKTQGTSSSRGCGDNSRSKSRSGTRTPTATPGMARYYEVPQTVARKGWEF